MRGDADESLQNQSEWNDWLIPSGSENRANLTAGLDRPYGLARVTPCNGLAMVDFAGGNPWQSNTKYYLQEQNAGGPLA